jgi:two-component system response regulator FixJ
MPAVANARERIDRTVPVLDERYRRLSRREREVGALVVFGMSRREIADELNISPRTVDTHKLHVLAKLECANDVALVWRAFEIGWVK